ncbi:hypothetical protein QAD02_020128 [Eretmocerus hayati]|uniref:Uncharacterized protein n=1 Tax=Eretmocerus hayati TaxID=131215 RepID=A0ACC2PLI5_9HYME|nr:hypothetical protein QAD02_020128 [Eretmocerus hayati]
MARRTWWTKEEGRAPCFKVAKDRFTSLFCANAFGDLKGKSMLVYHSETLRASRGKREDHLTVYWKSNKRPWVTKVNSEQCFHQSLIPEVKEFLRTRNLSFKMFLLMNNCKSHDQSSQTAHPHVSPSQHNVPNPTLRSDCHCYT